MATWTVDYYILGHIDVEAESEAEAKRVAGRELEFRSRREELIDWDDYGIETASKEG